MNVTINDPGKLAAILIVCICATILGALGKLTDVELAGLFGTVLGYVAGNGRLAQRGKPQSSLLVAKDPGTATDGLGPGDPA